MAYSIYAYLKPEAVNYDNPYLQHLFEECPWWKIPGDDGLLFMYCKPRKIEDRYMTFFSLLQELAEVDLLVEISDDEWLNEAPLKDKLRVRRFDRLIPYIK